jgi:hypothetical protein
MVSITAGMPGLLFYEDRDNIEYYDLPRIKPILRPLSELDKIIPEIDEFDTPLYLIKSKFNYPNLKFEYNSIYKDTEVSVGNTDQAFGYSVFQQLFEWHFDVFGLIPAGLALNK